MERRPARQIIKRDESGAMLLLAVTLVGSVLQLPGIGGGAQIASIVALTAIFGVEQEPAIAIAAVLWITTFAGNTLVGIPLLIHEGMSLGELRQLARAEAEAEGWFTGPPYAVVESVFDEYDQEGCTLNRDD